MDIAMFYFAAGDVLTHSVDKNDSPRPGNNRHYSRRGMGVKK